MALKQRARTPKGQLPMALAGIIPYGFATELRELDLTTFAVVACPWCGDLEVHPEPADEEPRYCQSTAERFVIVVPAGTPIMAPAS